MKGKREERGTEKEGREKCRDVKRGDRERVPGFVGHVKCHIGSEWKALNFPKVSSFLAHQRGSVLVMD